MLLILFYVEQLEGLYSRAIGIQYFSIISKFVKQARPRLPYFSISHNNRLKSWSQPEEKKLKKLQEETILQSDSSFCAFFQQSLLKNGDVCLLVHMDKITLTQK
jgi:hypothetical protein